MTKPSSTGASREAIARIVDPDAWRSWDRDPGAHRGSALLLTIRTSLEKADAILALPSGGEWLPIESAPRDGTPILALCVHENQKYAKTDEDRARWQEVVVTRWIDHNGGGWTWHGICGVHKLWRPLPSPPLPEAGG